MERLFHAYLMICNQAIAENGDVFPYKQIWAAAGAGMARRQVHVTVLDGRARHACRMILKDGMLGLMPEACCGCSGCYGELRAWHVTRAYLERVINHPHIYIAQPARLDWSWLQPGPDYLSAQGKPELQAGQENCAS